ncbi:MAG: CoA pyrophosphatase [Pseudomonadota bacterium]
MLALRADPADLAALKAAVLPLDHPVEAPELAPGHPLREILTAPLKPAAVLVPLVYRDSWNLILTQRAADLHHHGGQISFPGGRREGGDTSYIHTALRETREEIGIAEDQVEPLGYLNPIPVITGFGVVPVVGTIPASVNFALDPGEVAEVFEVPLSFVLDPANHQQETMERRGRRGTYFVLQFGSRRIWGATAAMLVDLARRLGA